MFKVLGLGIGVLLVVLFLGCTVYGVVLAFKASILLGLIALIVEPSPFIFGLVMLLCEVNLAEKIMVWVHS